MQNLNDLINLAHNKSHEARLELACKTSQEFLDCKDELSSEQIALFTDVINKLYDILPNAVKSQLSNALAINKWCPENILQTIAEDKIEFAAPILNFSDNLSDEALVSIIRSHGFDHQLLIANRPNIGLIVTDALADTDNEEIAIAVGKNINASISTHGYHKFIALIKTNKDALGYYAIRTDIPDELANEITIAIAKYYETPANSTNNGGMSVISAIGKKHKDTALNDCVNALTSGDKDGFIEQIANYFNVSKDKLKLGLSLGELSNFMLIARAMDFDAKAVEYLYNKYSSKPIKFDNNQNKEVLVYWITVPVGHAISEVRNKFA